MLKRGYFCSIGMTVRRPGISLKAAPLGRHTENQCLPVPGSSFRKVKVNNPSTTTVSVHFFQLDFKLFRRKVSLSKCNEVCRHMTLEQRPCPPLQTKTPSHTKPILCNHLKSSEAMVSSTGKYILSDMLSPLQTLKMPGSCLKAVTSDNFVLTGHIVLSWDCPYCMKQGRFIPGSRRPGHYYLLLTAIQRVTLQAWPRTSLCPCSCHPSHVTAIWPHLDNGSVLGLIR